MYKLYYSLQNHECRNRWLDPACFLYYLNGIVVATNAYRDGICCSSIYYNSDNSICYHCSDDFPVKIIPTKIKETFTKYI